MFEGTKGDTDLGSVTHVKLPTPGVSESLCVGDAVTVSYKAQDGADQAQVVLEWEGGSTSDMLADAIIAIVLQVRCHVAPWLGCDIRHEQASKLLPAKTRALGCICLRFVASACATAVQLELLTRCTSC